MIVILDATADLFPWRDRAPTGVGLQCLRRIEEAETLERGGPRRLCEILPDVLARYDKARARPAMRDDSFVEV